MALTFIHPEALWLLLLIPLTAGLAIIGPRQLTRKRIWSGLIIRILLLLMIILALAGIQVRTPSDNLTVVFLLDVSDSVNPIDQALGESIIKNAVRDMPVGDKAAVVVFGENALVEQIASDTRVLSDFASVPITTRTDIASALQLALALFPNDGAKRLVLLSDGRQNIGQAIDQAELAAAHGIELTYVPLGKSVEGTEVLLDRLQAPSSVRLGQIFNLQVEVNSTSTVEAELRLLADGILIHNVNVNIKSGINRFSIPFEPDRSGFRRFTAQIIPDQDIRLQNNTANTFTMVHGPPRVLIVEGSWDETQMTANPSEALARALISTNVDVTVIKAFEIPTSITDLADFESVVLVDVPATSIPLETMEALQVYVRDLGRGLLMIGGSQSYGAGGYLRTPIEETLPVYMDVRTKDQEANLALVLAIDKSGSMGRCHCDDPDLTQSYTRQESGQPKVDIAKEAVMRAASALGIQDFLGVVAFDDAAKWAVKTQKLVDPSTLEKNIGGIPAQGQTNLQSGVEAAYESLLEIEAKRKHIILLTDGWVRQTSLLNQVKEMQKNGVTLSVVAAGGGSARYLEELSTNGGGIYYPAEDILRVPDFFLKETVTAVGRYIIEEPFYPLPGLTSPIMSNLDTTALPPLYGYNGTTPKGTARLDLITPRGDPLLATWQYGLGRAAAWTSDLAPRWATQWLTWDDFPRFVAQLVSWTLPTPKTEGISTSAYVEENQGVIELVAKDQLDQPINFLYVHASIIKPDFTKLESGLEQTGPGKYRSVINLDQPGIYLIRLGINNDDQSLGGEILGLVMPYSPEYRASGTDISFLREIARVTGGEELVDPLGAFVHDLEATAKAREIWQPLLLIVALLFPLDVALRRLMLGRSDYQKAIDWIYSNIPWRDKIRDGTGKTNSATQSLFDARNRARQWQRRSTSGKMINVDEESESIKENAGSKVNDPEDMLSRLKRAKRSARREDE